MRRNQYRRHKMVNPRERVKWLATISIAIGGLAFITSWIPIVNNGSFGMALLALVFGLIAISLNFKRKKMLSLIGIALSITSMCIVLVTQDMYSKAFEDSTNTNSLKTTKNKEKKHNSKKVSSILNKAITIENGKAEFMVTRWKVISPEETSGKDEEKPLIVFWYNVKNINMKDDDHFDPMSAWVSSANIDLIQDTNNNQVNTLDIQGVPYAKYQNTSNQKIKKGGTAESVVSYELTNKETPVTLKVYSSFDKEKNSLIGQQTFNIKK